MLVLIVVVLFVKWVRSALPVTLKATDSPNFFSTGASIFNVLSIILFSI
jgi:hypothetical protein